MGQGEAPGAHRDALGERGEAGGGADPLEGRARELVEAKLNTETQKLAAAEQQLAEAERALERVEGAERETRGVIAALQDFKEVWEMMTPENRGRMLRALVDRVEVDRRSTSSTSRRPRRWWWRRG